MKVQRIISFATLAISIFTLILVVEATCAGCDSVAARGGRGQCAVVSRKGERVSSAEGAGEGQSEVRINSNELSAALAQAAGLMPAAVTPSSTSSPANSSSNTSGGSAAPTGPGMEFPGPSQMLRTIR